MSLTGDILARIALDAGQLIMQVYATDFNVDRKDDKRDLYCSTARAVL